MAHAVEIITATTQKSNPSTVPSPSPPDFSASLIRDRVSQNVLGNHTEVLPGQQSDMSKVSPIDGGTDHFRGLYRFDDADTKKAILDDIENNAVIDASWYEVRYHSCTHDGQGGACDNWTVERSGGTPPSDV